MIRQPMKAPSKSITDAQIDLLTYPVFGSWKLDGILCLTENRAYTSSMKLIQNRFIQRTLARAEYAGLQGEIIVGDPLDPKSFKNTSGAVRAKDGRPDFTFYVFDTFHGPERPYEERLKELWLRASFGVPRLKVLEQKPLKNPVEVRAFLAWCIEHNLEGLIVRGPKAPYKEGRGTWKGQHAFKIKPFEDDEAEIVGFIARNRNDNEAFTDERGRTKRSKHRANMVPLDTLGKLEIISHNKKHPWCGKVITCGCGQMSHEEAKYIWDHKDEFMNQIGVYKFQVIGSEELPRLPIWKGLRDKSDITDY
jgi:DNA ligase 1